jgi:hypothetical protein
LHTRADAGISHPGWYLDNYAAGDFDEHDTAGGKLFTVLHWQPLSV